MNLSESPRISNRLAQKRTQDKSHYKDSEFITDFTRKKKRKSSTQEDAGNTHRQIGGTALAQTGVGSDSPVPENPKLIETEKDERKQLDKIPALPRDVTKVRIKEEKSGDEKAQIQKSPNVEPVVLTPKRGRGRPRKISATPGKPLDTPGIKKAPPVSSSARKDGASKDMLINTLLSEKENKNQDDVFSLVAALVSGSVLSAIPGSAAVALRAVTSQAGIHLLSQGRTSDQDVHIVYGTLDKLTSAGKMLRKIRDSEATLSGGPPKRPKGRPRRLTEGSRRHSPGQKTANRTESSPDREAIDKASARRKSREERAQGRKGEGDLGKNDAVENLEDTLQEPVDADEEQTGDPDEDLADSYHGDDHAAVDTTEGTNLNVAIKTEKPDDEEYGTPLAPKVRKQRQLLRGGLCAHHDEDCQRCTHKCDQCSYRSSLVGVKKHQIRVHPTTTFNCEICGRRFGIRYDMRRHRLIHFDMSGHLTEQGRDVYAKYTGEDDVITLADLEIDFHLDGKPSENDAAITEENSGGSEQTDAASPSLERSEDTPEVKTKRESVAPDGDIAKTTGGVTCVVCQLTGSLDEVWSHKQEAHQAAAGDTKIPESEPGAEGGAVQCQCCSFQGSESAVASHRAAAHWEAYSCQQCGAVLPDHVTARSHVEEHRAKAKRLKHLMLPPRESSILYKCGVCETIFKRRAALQLHLRSHGATRVLSCEQCGFQCTRKGQMRAHERRNHAPLAERQCGLCRRDFTTPTSLRFHMDTVHGSSGKCSCGECGKTFNAARFLNAHIKRIHRQERSHFCPTCGRGFFERARMLEHSHVHLTDAERERTKKHVCTYCGKAFAQRATLKQHENTHTGRRPYKCHQCPKAFCYNSELNKHAVAHADSRPHICHHCGKGFKFRYKLTAHIVTHTRQGRHRCHRCDKVFTANSSLVKHNCKAIAHDDGIRRVVLDYGPAGGMLAVKREAEDGSGPGLEEGLDADQGGPLVIAYATAAEAAGDDDEAEVLGDGEQDETLVEVATLVGHHGHGGTHGGAFQVIPADGSSVATLATAGLHGNEQVIELPMGSLAETHFVAMTTEDVTAAEGLVMSDFQVATENVVEDSKTFVGDGQQLAEEGEGVMYMCGACNQLFEDQEAVTVHMEVEHSAPDTVINLS